MTDEEEAQSSAKISRKLSTLESTIDPFSERIGRTLVWTEVNMVLNKDGRKLLDNVWGEVPAQQTTAIMGPSGAGKTSLLNILAGRVTSNANITVSSDIRLDNVGVDPTRMEVRQSMAFVAQDDSLPVTATPREAIRFSAKLRLPKNTSEKQLDKLVERMLEELGLKSCADTYIGGALLKGVSGGERKRTSVGVELVTKPSIVFLDEPTSGLDSFSAVQLCQVLKRVARSGASVLFTIHQPSSEIFNSFDHLILMNKGRVMYQGSTSNVPDYFEERNHPNPPHYNPADWVMEVAQSIPIERLNSDGFFPEDHRELGQALEPEKGKDALGITKRGSKVDSNGGDVPPPGMITQIQALFDREIKNLYRDTTAIGTRFGLTIFLSILIGIIFKGVGATYSGEQVNIQSHFGALTIVALSGMFGTAQPALLAFPDERPVFLREYSTNHYHVLAYFLSRFTMEAVVTALQILVQSIITFFMIEFQMSFIMFYVTIYSLAMTSTALAVLLGCAVEDPKLGQEMLPILFVPQMLFAGFFVAPALIPSWLRWARYLCALTYAIRILLIEEFENCNPADPVENDRCNQLVNDVAADSDETWWYWLVLIVLFGVFRIMAVGVLSQKATKFL